MKAFYDFEFLDNGETIEPITMGLVTNYGLRLYWINSTFNWDRTGDQMDWLKSHVRPHVYHFPTEATTLDCDRTTVAAVVRQALDHKDLELWGYHSSYDHVALAQLFGPMVNWPFARTMFTRDLKFLMYERGVTLNQLPPKPQPAHHSYFDAMWVMKSEEAIRDLKR